MTAVLPRDRVLAEASPSWRLVSEQLTWRHAAAVLLAAMMMSVATWAYMFDKLDKPGVPTLMMFEVLSAFVLFGFALLAWMTAVRSGDAGREQRRLFTAIIASGALAAAVSCSISYAAGLEEVWMSIMEKKRDPPPVWLVYVGATVQFSLYAFLFIAAAEVLRRRTATQLAFQSAQREQAAIAREVLESRLTAMQAQVEPQFLFDSLVDIEKLYRKDPHRAATDLDRLITYLRVALPRLREPGSTIEAEIELVRAYLAVVTSLHEGSPTLTITLPDDCRCALFYPMLLLPLLQRAVRHPSGALPESVEIGVSRVGSQIAIVLRFALPDHCDDDPELARVRERLAGLFGAAASLDCEEIGGFTQITMRVPAAESATR
jgi:hypothetical protein